MTGETLYPRLEPLLAQIQKPIQYVGGELNAQVKPWDDAAVHWALMYPDAYEVGLPNQGLMILYEVLNERPDALAERTYAVWPDLAALMRENGVPQFTVDGHRAGRATSTCSASASPPSSATPTCSRRSTSPASRCTRSTATRATRSSSPAGTPRSTPSRSPTSSTAPSSATASRSSATSPTSSRRGRRRASPAAASSCSPAWPASTASTCRASTRSPTARTARSRRSSRTRDDVPARIGKRTVMDLDEWPYPKTPIVPLAEIGARADERRDLPRLHPRLPLLPGRDDHPPGARADDHRHRLDGRAGPQGDRLRGGRAARRCPAPTTPRSASSPRSSPTATRAPTPASACRPPASTPSTSRWPTSCPATDGAPA